MQERPAEDLQRRTLLIAPPTRSARQRFNRQAGHLNLTFKTEKTGLTESKRAETAHPSLLSVQDNPESGAVRYHLEIVECPRDGSPADRYEGSRAVPCVDGDIHGNVVARRQPYKSVLQRQQFPGGISACGV